MRGPVGAVVCFVIGVADALDFLPADRAGLAVATVGCHIILERCDFFGECRAAFGAQAVDPKFQRGLGAFEKPNPFFGLEFFGLRQRGEAGGVRNLDQSVPS